MLIKHFSEENPLNSSHIVIESAFGAEECQKIIRMPPHRLIDSGENLSVYNQDNDFHNTHSKLIIHNQENTWLFQKLVNLAMEANKNFFKMDISSLNETYILEYRKGDYFRPHMDINDFSASTRKLSLVLLLSEPGDYQGGELEFIPSVGEISQNQGNLIIFPSYMVHQVRKLKKGIRFSMVSWIHGPVFR